MNPIGRFMGSRNLSRRFTRVYHAGISNNNENRDLHFGKRRESDSGRKDRMRSRAQAWRRFGGSKTGVDILTALKDGDSF